MGKIPPFEPVLSNVGEQPNVKAGGTTLGPRTPRGSIRLNTLRRSTENVVRAASSGTARGTISVC